MMFYVSNAVYFFAETSPSEKAGPSSSTSTPSRANIKTVPAAASKRKRLTSNEAFEVKKIKASPATRVNTKVKIKQSPAVKQKQKVSATLMIWHTV